jgi:glucose-1-phosphate cytidylyltransferase
VKVVILAGGLGTRLGEETAVRPKPMVEIGGRPILWHIMNSYAAYGFREFVVALGYRSHVVKDYFLKYYHNHQNDLTIELKTGKVSTSGKNNEDWIVHLVETGKDTMNGGRLGRLRNLLAEGTFMLTYGDGVSDIDLARLLSFHRAHGKLATVTAVRPAARFGGLRLRGDDVEEFKEKPQTGEGWVNGGFFVFEPAVLGLIEGDESVLEGAPLETLAQKGELAAFRHDGFWQCMDTVRDRNLLERLWESGHAPWVPAR